MKKKRTIRDLCQEFHLTEMEVQRFMKEGALAFTFRKGREIVFTDRQVKAFGPICYKYKAKKEQFIENGRKAIQKMKSSIQEMKGSLPPLPRPPLKIEKIEPQPEPEAIKVELIKPEKAIRNDDIIPLVDETEDQKIDENDASPEQIELLKENIIQTKIKGAIFNPCEWNPKVNGKNEGLGGIWDHHEKATWILGAKGKWRLCDKCAELPEFNRYRVRKRIEK